MGHYVYKYVHDDEIIYIGKNDTTLAARVEQHNREEKFIPYLNSKIYYIELANSIMSDVVESELIRRYKPKLNVAKTSDWSGLDFPEPDWKLFVPLKCQEKSKNKKDQPHISKKDLMTYKFMSSYYCPMLLRNINNVEESDSHYDITIPINKEDTEHAYCVPPYIIYDIGRVHGGISLGYCYTSDKTVTYRFNKKALYDEYYDIPSGLAPRIRYMQEMFENKYNELSEL